MGNINYEIVEKRLIKGMSDWTKKRLRQEVVKRSEKFLRPSSVSKKRPIPQRLAFIRQLQKDLERYHVRDKHIYRTLGFPARHLKFALTMYEHLPDEQWAKVEGLREKFDAYCQANPFKDEEGEVESAEETQVETERVRHTTKRHNVRDGWIPS